MNAAPEEAFAQRLRVREMRDLLDAVLRGTRVRADVTAWTRRVHDPETYEPSVFAGHGVANTVFDSIWNIEEQSDAEPVIRERDLRAYIEWLDRGGLRRPSETLLACLDWPMPALEARVGLEAVRFMREGLGWTDALTFASHASGRTFVAQSSWLAPAPRCSIASVGHDDDGAAALSDLLDTLAIDASELAPIDGGPVLDELPRFALVRQDDHGTRYVVQVFRGYAVAVRACERMQGQPHKQTYWVERLVEPGRS